MPDAHRLRGVGRRLRPSDGLTALDRAWRRQSKRLEQAHDDWALHGTAGDPRSAIHRAAGLVRLRRRTVRECVRACRRVKADPAASSAAMLTARRKIAEAFRAYRSAITDLARAVSTFEADVGLLTHGSELSVDRRP